MSSSITWLDVKAQERANGLVTKPIPTNTLAGEAVNVLLQASTTQSKTTKAMLIMRADAMLSSYTTEIRQRDGSVTIAAVLQLILEEIVKSQA